MPLLKLYRYATLLATPLAERALDWRAAHGKEDSARLDERMGRASRPRPAGRLVWLHGASLGELIWVVRWVKRRAETLASSRARCAFG